MPYSLMNHVLLFGNTSYAQLGCPLYFNCKNIMMHHGIHILLSIDSLF